MTGLRVVSYSLLLTVLVVVIGHSARADQPDQPATEFVNLLGDKYRLPQPEQCRAVVLLFVGHDCPISNSYAKEIVRLGDDFVPQKISFCVVYADSDIREEEARKHAQEFGFNSPAILDPEMILARRVGAKIKPEAAVLSPSGEVLYLGRIDNRYVDFGKRREQVTSHDLREALQAVLVGKPISNPRTTAIGCDIDLPQKAQ